MFRFFCTVEKKVKRVQNIPKNIDRDTISLGNPTDRIGICDAHSRTRLTKKIAEKIRVIAEPMKVNNRKRR